jgi:hypothetical protein
VEDVFENAAKVIRMNEDLHERWRKQFADGQDSDGDDLMGDKTGGESFYPFASELDWRIANWVIKDSPGNNAFDRLLSIPGVCFLTFWRI